MEYKHYAMLSKYGNCARLPKTKNKLKIGYFCKKRREEFSLFCVCFYENNYPTRACWIWDNYSQIGARRLVGYYKLISNARSRNICYIFAILIG